MAAMHVRSWLVRFLRGRNKTTKHLCFVPGVPSHMFCNGSKFKASGFCGAGKRGQEPW